MKNNLPKKTAAKSANATPAPKKAVKKVPAAKAIDKPAAKAAKPAAATKPVKSATAKPVTTKPAKSIATKPATAPKSRKSPAANAQEKSLQPVTTFVAQVEIGWGNSLYLRGEGAPELSWERGILMKWEDGSWVYSTTGAKVPVAFKFLINDQIWAEGHNQRVEPGATSITTPHFHY